MNVITNEFKNAVIGQLLDLKPGFYLTREQLCLGAGVDPKFAGVVSLLMTEPEFADFEGVKSRGYRRKKVSDPVAA